MDQQQYDAIDNDENDLPNHTISMRQAFRFCQNIVSSQKLKFVRGDKDQHEAMSTLASQRIEACRQFWNDTPQIETVTAASLSPCDFRKMFHNRNLPAVVVGLDEETCFASIVKKWRLADGSINRQWFLDNIGEDTLVPLRQQHLATELDEEGRAEECETRQVAIKEWFEYLDTANGDNELHPSLYLKDWHLLLLLQERSSNQLPLYECPKFFQYDLLNSFLTKFTKGDYKFCYWGPSLSSTTKHSDVLHSFSWSFNVAGTKEWTFYSPFGSESLTVIQRAGECMFVPCTWQHQVVNLEEKETASINHNWITVANIDQTWECLVIEMRAVEKELYAWGIGDENIESRESMLRGCVGLDVTAFFFMLLTRLLELLSEENANNAETSFDVYRLIDMLQLLVDDKKVRVKDRLAAVLQSEAYAQESMELAAKAIITAEEAV
jgi:hypothetical protein